MAPTKAASKKGAGASKKVASKGITGKVKEDVKKEVVSRKRKEGQAAKKKAEAGPSKTTQAGGKEEKKAKGPVGKAREKEIIKRLRGNGWTKLITEGSPGLWSKWGPLVRSRKPLTDAEWKSIIPKLKRLHEAKQVLLWYAPPSEFNLEKDDKPPKKSKSKPSDPDLAPPSNGFESVPLRFGYDSDDDLPDQPFVDCDPEVIKYLSFGHLYDLTHYRGEYIYRVLEGYDEGPYMEDEDWAPSEPESI